MQQEQHTMHGQFSETPFGEAPLSEAANPREA